MAAPMEESGNRIFILLGVMIFGFLLAGLVFCYMIIKAREKSLQRQQEDLSRQQREGTVAVADAERSIGLTALQPGRQRAGTKVMKLEQINDLFPMFQYNRSKHEASTVKGEIAASTDEDVLDSQKSESSLNVSQQHESVSNKNSRCEVPESGLSENQPDKPASAEDCCAVCLDAIKKEKNLRKLACSHIFHADCIDPWLTERFARCPVCKMDMI
ncbi:hypothetical protein LOZ61_006397 [Ophidiomyces ophidiicola]|uniref:Uncharacterized protein n=1 Tax=Ophidiomyces ophidiicola TaxID=1387563 RepID=A0ACB8UPI6_9EURO|nr:hypothetical protein LOZ61_006397 [Ophidiomyces ophidiicola]KAI1921657.1 hypothetical protein LOZ60_006107 [Ophidiomyces ophidiicola]KAI1949549.1 hypothetical protein LOZ59_006076 [Ophidiomyces ophidiicola]KAI1964560.1 hypothetical protein LOZ56_006152 [Ophidiomyces ophidiicola]KAI2028141.1 hypothetical protein LOZ48_004372 [Ophidiomyces ophidiicola]